MDTFATRAKARRLELGLSQDQAAALSGLKQPDISKIERGKIQQTTEILGLARALRCNPDDPIKAKEILVSTYQPFEDASASMEKCLDLLERSL